MKFIKLLEPCISSDHVLAVSPLLYRLDARTIAGYFVLNEYEDRRPSISLNGDMDECQNLIRRVIRMLNEGSIFDRMLNGGNGFDRSRCEFIGKPFDFPVFTLDMRTPTYQALVSGLPDDTFRVAVFGNSTETFLVDVAEIAARLVELVRVYYQ
jgi:hypothetical protein